AITAKRAAIVSSLIIAPFGIMVAFLGLIAKTGMFFETSAVTNPKMVLSTLLTTPEFINPYLGGLALAGVLAAILSTVGPVNFAIVTIVVKDMYHAIINKDADDKKLLKTAKNLVLLVNVVTIPLAIFIHGAILEAAYVSYAIRAIGAIVIVLGVYKRNWITSTGVILAFIGGTITIFVCVIANNIGWFSVDKTYGAVISAVVFIAIGNLWEKYRKLHS
ncbi:MAG: hypothetical protein KAH33_07645, partial [Candidatus Delongbacteria bacterium]|nr:hypothetical protein [Candidatus Delongbacteria bacterium]